MSVSGVPSIPGFDVLFPSGNTASSSVTPADAPAPAPAPAPATTNSADKPAGFDILFPAAKATPASSSSTASTQDPYKAAYNNIETWSSSYLMNAVENGSSDGIPQYSGGESASSFAQLNSTLAALKPLIAIEGAEQNPSQSASTSKTGSTVDSLA